MARPKRGELPRTAVQKHVSLNNVHDRALKRYQEQLARDWSVESVSVGAAVEALIEEKFGESDVELKEYIDLRQKIRIINSANKTEQEEATQE